jgi:hypothetical protein
MKSPLKDNPLRNPGESLDKEITEFLYDEVLTYIFVSILMVSIAGLEWAKWYLKTPPAPWLYSFIAFLTIAYSVLKIINAKSKLKPLKQGRDGEKAVGQYLEKLRERGAQVFHDIPSKGFNLDHVVVTQTGIYVIETKTYSKPEKGKAKIVFDGESLQINGKFRNDKPIVQVKAASNWLSEILVESTGKKFTIKPVVVFPGWFIESTAKAQSSGVWVLNPKALPTFIENSTDKLKPEEVKMVSFHLSRYIRSYSE